MVHKHQKQLPHELHNLYRLWLLTRPTQPGEEIPTVLDLPTRLCEGKGPIKQGLTLPYPSGPHWNNLLSNKVTQKMYANRLHEDDEEEEQTYNARLAFELMQARLIRVVGLRVAEPLVLYNYEGGPNAKVTNTGRTTSPK